MIQLPVYVTPYILSRGAYTQVVCVRLEMARPSVEAFVGCEATCNEAENNWVRGAADAESSGQRLGGQGKGAACAENGREDAVRHHVRRELSMYGAEAGSRPNALMQ